MQMPSEGFHSPVCLCPTCCASSSPRGSLLLCHGSPLCLLRVSHPRPSVLPGPSAWSISTQCLLGWLLLSLQQSACVALLWGSLPWPLPPNMPLATPLPQQPVFLHGLCHDSDCSLPFVCMLILYLPFKDSTFVLE